MSDRLAIDGGVPVRDVQQRPWVKWPVVSEGEWRARVEPALRDVYMSQTEGLPGPRARAFAARFAAYCGARYGRMLVHGTDAIGAALVATLDLDAWGEGGEVILPNYTFIATASAALDRRCRLAFVDVAPATFTIDPAAVEVAIRPGVTRAILAVHLAGQPAEMDAILAIAAKHGLKVIEDCAQAHGARYRDRPVGSIGHAGAFSFQSTKNLTAGEGGLVTTNDADVDGRVAAFMDVGRDPRAGQWEYPRLGWNYRPSEYLAALLDVRLDDLERQTEHRARMAGYLRERLRAIPGVVPPVVAEGTGRHAYHLYAILIEPAQFGGRSREQIVDAIKAEGIACVPGYTSPLSESQALMKLRERYPDVVRVLPCPNVEDVCTRSIWLKQEMLLMEERDMDDIVEAFTRVQSYYARHPVK
jgi:dTDP-4-amino-4,6-dideoxygalactose transaminase